MCTIQIQSHFSYGSNLQVQNVQSKPYSILIDRSPTNQPCIVSKIDTLDFKVVAPLSHEQVNSECWRETVAARGRDGSSPVFLQGTPA